MLFRVLISAWLMQPAADQPVLQRPGQTEPRSPDAEPPSPVVEPPSPAAEHPPAPTPPAPTPQRPQAVVPLGAPESAPGPESAPPVVEQLVPVSPPPPPPRPPPVVDEPIERPKGPGTALIAVGSVLGAGGIIVTGAALASDRFAPQAWQRAVVVPIALGALCGGAALLIIGIDRRVRTKRWREQGALTPVVSPVERGLALGLGGQF